MKMTIYGRCMSKKRARELARVGELLDRSGDPVPVFDSPNYLIGRLERMGKDKLRAFFKKVGVRALEAVVFFQVDGIVDGIVGPIPQSNGLREYKIPNGTRVNVYASIRL